MLHIFDKRSSKKDKELLPDGEVASVVPKLLELVESSSGEQGRTHDAHEHFLWCEVCNATGPGLIYIFLANLKYFKMRSTAIKAKLALESWLFVIKNYRRTHTTCCELKF